MHTVFENSSTLDALREILLAKYFTLSLNLGPSPAPSKNGNKRPDRNSSSPHSTLFSDVFHSSFIPSNCSPSISPPPSSPISTENINIDNIHQPTHSIMFTNEDHYDNDHSDGTVTSTISHLRNRNQRENRSNRSVVYFHGTTSIGYFQDDHDVVFNRYLSYIQAPPTRAFIHYPN